MLYSTEYGRTDGLFVVASEAAPDDTLDSVLTVCDDSDLKRPLIFLATRVRRSTPPQHTVSTRKPRFIRCGTVLRVVRTTMRRRSIPQLDHACGRRGLDSILTFVVESDHANLQTTATISDELANDTDPDTL